ncbi:MAG TPA: universal stress protein [Marmoricola sp.]|nr:universal stress protein [Marmoricola sp.]
MAINPTPEGMILVGTDGSQCAQRAIDWAAREAEMRGSRLTILAAWAPRRSPDATLWVFGYAGSKLSESIHEQQLVAATELVVEAARGVRERYPDLEVQTVTHPGDARDALVDYGERASLIVVGSRGAGALSSTVLGSVAFWLTRHSEVPVAVVPADAEHVVGPTRRGVVVGVGFDPLAAKVVEAAAQEAEERRSALILAFCAWDGEASKHRWERVEESELESIGVDIVQKLASAVRSEYPHLDVRCRFARGAADRFLADTSRHHELLVLGRRISTPLDLVDVGTMAAAVLHHAPFVVMVVPLTKADDDALVASGTLFPPARAV